MRFSTVLVANRGEIAVRVMRTARALGYRTVAVYSDPDAAAPHVRAADTAVHIGPGPSSESYLSIERVLDAARAAGAGAIHPGYGFLAENPAFARAVAAAGLVFVGPSADTMEQIGNKARARVLAAELGVPTVPGYQGESASDDVLVREALRIGFPLMIKAAAGGGGRGMRRVERAADMADNIARARSEAERAFGDGTLLLERAIDHGHHVEVQIVGDLHGNVVHLGERDCSVQRRFQKIIEESPSPRVDGAMRARLGDAAVRLAKHVGYAGAGTVEFLVDAGGGFYFLEVNARLQVEHPVTELVTGRDLVAWQFAVAEGEPLPARQEDIVFHGHAIEARLLAEDPAQGFLPQTGRIARWAPPAGVRVDHGVEAGFEVTPFYDSMLAKVIAHAPTRDAARRRLRAALEQLQIFGVTTNQALLAEILEHDDFASGEVHTRWLEEKIVVAPLAATQPSEMAVVGAVLALYARAAQGALAGWSNTTALSWPIVVEQGEQRYAASLSVRRAPFSLSVRVGQTTHEIERDGESEAEIAFTKGGIRHHFGIYFDKSTRDAEPVLFLADGARAFRFRDATYAPSGARADGAGSGKVLAPMDGTIVDIVMKEGDRVEKGQAIVVLEAMKMQLRLAADIAGTVTRMFAETGKSVRQRQLLAGNRARRGARLVNRGIFRDGLFAGKVAVVTGGATGIGLAIAEELVVLGARVVIASRKGSRLKTAAKGLSRDHATEVVPFVCDIRNRVEVDALVDGTLARFGRIDCVVNNGGGQFLSPAESISERGWRAVIETNLNGTWNVCQSVAQKWMLAHGGTIVSIVADMWRGFPGMAHTGAARAGVVNLTQTLAVEWARYGIRVNAVAPGIILSTGMHNYPPGTVDTVGRTIPLKRLGTPEEVASAVLYLLSPAAGFVTGATLRVDGGASLWGNAWPIADPETAPPYQIPPWPEERWPDLVEAEDAGASPRKET